MERYEKLRVIGQGAFGKVFLVQRITDSRQVVIKQIPVDDLGKEERLAALNEVKVLAMLKHPNIIAYYDNFVDEKSLMIVMEYAPGGTLHEFIQERNLVLLDEDHILLFFVQLLVAIEHIHLLNILHRDLKTQNVMMNRKRNILKIGDFGISKVLSTKITSAQTVVGTPCYISPEICEGKLYATKSDLWALGCILYELTTLRKAFEGPNLPALVLKIMQASAVLDPIDPRYSDGLKALIYSLLQRQPDDRPSVHQVMATPVLINAHMNLATDVGRLPCTKLDSETSLPINCTRMNSKGELMNSTFVVEPYNPPGGSREDKSPKPLVYLWGGGVTVLMKLDPPVSLTDSKVVSVTCGRTQKSAVTDDGKLINWEVSAGSLGTTRLTTAAAGGKGGGGRGRKRDPLQFEPILISGLKTTSIKKVACGDMFNACLTDKGILMTFGSGANGALGHGDNKDVKEPKLVKAMLEFETTEVACGSYHVIAITSEGSVYAWGCGDKGQLGLGSNEQHHTPQRVWLPTNAEVPVQACCGSDCSMIVTNSGQVFATGANRENKLTLDKKAVQEPTKGTEEASPSKSATATSRGTDGSREATTSQSGDPAILQLLKSQSKMSQSFYIASMQKEEKGRGMGGALGGVTLGAPSSGTMAGGRSFTWGGGGGGGVASRPKWMVSEVSRFTMTGSELVQERNVISAAMGINHVALLTASGEVLTCGDNRYGQLGYRKATPPVAIDPAHSPSPKAERLPEVVTSLQDVEVTRLECGDSFCIACCKDGAVYSWGRGHGGRLGKDVEEDVFEPQKISFEFPSHEVQDLSCRHGVTMLLTVPQ